MPHLVAAEEALEKPVIPRRIRRTQPLTGQTSIWTTPLLGRALAGYRMIQDSFRTVSISFRSRSPALHSPVTAFTLAHIIEHRHFSFALAVHAPDVAQLASGHQTSPRGPVHTHTFSLYLGPFGLARSVLVPYMIPSPG